MASALQPVKLTIRFMLASVHSIHFSASTRRYALFDESLDTLFDKPLDTLFDELLEARSYVDDRSTRRHAINRRAPSEAHLRPSSRRVKNAPTPARAYARALLSSSSALAFLRTRARNSQHSGSFR